MPCASFAMSLQFKYSVLYTFDAENWTRCHEVLVLTLIDDKARFAVTLHAEKVFMLTLEKSIT